MTDADPKDVKKVSEDEKESPNEATSKPDVSMDEDDDHIEKRLKELENSEKIEKMTDDDFLMGIDMEMVDDAKTVQEDEEEEPVAVEEPDFFGPEPKRRKTSSNGSDGEEPTSGDEPKQNSLLEKSALIRRSRRKRDKNGVLWVRKPLSVFFF